MNRNKKASSFLLVSLLFMVDKVMANIMQPDFTSDGWKNWY